MHRIDHANREIDGNGAGKDGFTEGDVLTQVPATGVTADWLNAIQEEIATVVEEVGLSLDKNDNTQLLDSIRGLIALRTEARITPPQITANQDNYAPTGWSDATFVRLSSDASRTIKGFGPANVAKKTLVNVGSFNIRFEYDATGQTAGNQIAPGPDDSFTTYVLAPGNAVDVLNDASTSKWRVLDRDISDADWTFKGDNTFHGTSDFQGDIVGDLSIPAANIELGTGGINIAGSTGDRIVLDAGNIRLDNGGVVASGYVTSETGFRHHVPPAAMPQRGMWIGLSEFSPCRVTTDPITEAWSLEHEPEHYWEAHDPSSNNALCAQINLPHGATLASVTACVFQETDAAADMTLTVVRVAPDRTGPTYSNSAQSPIGAATLASFGSNQLLVVSPGETIDNDNYKYMIRVNASNAGAGNTDRLLWCRVLYSDPGPNSPGGALQ